MGSMGAKVCSLPRDKLYSWGNIPTPFHNENVFTLAAAVRFREAREWGIYVGYFLRPICAFCVDPALIISLALRE